MQETWSTVIEKLQNYVGDSYHMILLAAALVYLLVTVKKHREHLVLLTVTLLFAVIYFCPVTAGIIMKAFIGRSVYWRMLWVLPAILITAYAGASLLARCRGRLERAAVLAVLVAAIAVSGTCMYGNGSYAPAENLYKLPEPTISVCKLIRSDAHSRQVESVKVLVPNDLVCYIRQYDASFLMPYGRNVFRGEDLTENQAGLFAQMSSEEADPAVLNALLRKEGCSYFVWDRQDETREALETYGFVPVGDVGGCRVFWISG